MYDFDIDTDTADEVAWFQHAIDDGSVWHLEGAMGRAAMGLINSGQCVVGAEPHRDFYGNLVPSRDMLEEGTKGTFGFVEERMGADYAEWLRGVAA